MYALLLMAEKTMVRPSIIQIMQRLCLLLIGLLLAFSPPKSSCATTAPSMQTLYNKIGAFNGFLQRQPSSGVVYAVYVHSTGALRDMGNANHCSSMEAIDHLSMAAVVQNGFVLAIVFGASLVPWPDKIERLFERILGNLVIIRRFRALRSTSLFLSEALLRAIGIRPPAFSNERHASAAPFRRAFKRLLAALMGFCLDKLLQDRVEPILPERQRQTLLPHLGLKEGPYNASLVLKHFFSVRLTLEAVVDMVYALQLLLQKQDSVAVNNRQRHVDYFGGIAFISFFLVTLMFLVSVLVIMSCLPSPRDKNLTMKVLKKKRRKSKKRKALRRLLIRHRRLSEIPTSSS